MRIGIYGYGNLARGVEAAIGQNPDATLVGVFTRRDPASVKTASGAPAYHSSSVFDFKDKIDVLIICGGSATDLPEMTPAFAEDFLRVLDSAMQQPPFFADLCRTGVHNSVTDG